MALFILSRRSPVLLERCTKNNEVENPVRSGYLCKVEVSSSNKLYCPFQSELIDVIIGPYIRRAFSLLYNVARLIYIFYKEMQYPIILNYPNFLQ